VNPASHEHDIVILATQHTIQSADRTLPQLV
jgi:hypothetical protein